MSDRERVTIDRVGPAARHLIGVAVSSGIGAQGLRVVLAILELTATWSRIEDRTTRRQIADLAGVSDATVKRTLARLDKLGAIEWRPARGRGALSTLRLVDPPSEQHAHLTSPLTAHPDDPLKTPKSGRPDDPISPRKRVKSRPKTGQIEAENGSSRWPATEKYRGITNSGAFSFDREFARRQARAAAAALRAGQFDDLRAGRTVEVIDAVLTITPKEVTL